MSAGDRPPGGQSRGASAVHWPPCLRSPATPSSLTIDTLAYGGQGIARVDGFVVFVRGALPGDRRARRGDAPQARLRRGAPARAARAVGAPRGVAATIRPTPAAASGRRSTTPRSSSSSSARWSSRWRTSAASTQVASTPIRGMDEPWRYRNKMEYSFGQRDGEMVLGMHRRGSWREIVDIPTATWRRSRSRGRGRRSDRLPRPRACRPTRRRPTRACCATSWCARPGHRRPAAQPVRHRALPAGARARRARRRRAAVHLVRRDRQRDPGRRRGGRRPVHGRGPPYFHEELAGVRLRVPALAFLQTNSEMCGVLYETALRAARPKAGRRAYDLYCGIGGLSLLLARRAARVYGLELQEEAIAAAAENARLNGVANLDFAAGDVRKLLLDPPTGRDPEDRPPRAGRRQAASRCGRRRAALRAARRRASPTRRAPAWPRRRWSAWRCSAPSASSTCRATRRPWPPTPPSSPPRLRPRRGHAGRHVPPHPPHRDGGDLREV